MNCCITEPAVDNEQTTQIINRSANSTN